MQVALQPLTIDGRADDRQILRQQAAEDLDLDGLSRLGQRATDRPQGKRVPTFGLQRASRQLDIVEAGADRCADLLWSDHTSIAHNLPRRWRRSSIIPPTASLQICA